MQDLRARWIAWPLLWSLAVLPCVAKSLSKDQKRAREVYKEATKLVEQHEEERASEKINDAIDLDPQPEYLSLREYLRQLRVSAHLKRGTELLGKGEKQQAAGEFRAALSIDPANPLAQERLRSAAAQILGTPQIRPKIEYRDEEEVELAPNDAKREIKYRGGVRSFLEQIWRTYGITAIVDQSVQERQLRVEVEPLDFSHAIELGSQLTKSFYVPLSPKQVLILGDTQENRRQYERLALRTFSLAATSSPQELNDLLNLLRTVFDFRYLATAPSQSEIVVRAPRDLLDAATRIIEDLSQGKPQVMLDVKIYEVNRTFARDLGLQLPLQFRIFNVNTEAANLLNNPSTSQLIQQLIASGLINQANSTGIAALLGALASQGNSLLNQPIATFGGGITRSGIVLPGTTAHFNLNESAVETLEDVSIRAQHGDAATFRAGTRFPILNAIFSPISSSAALTQVLGNRSFQAPFPSFNYEDLGVTVKATPLIHGTEDVTLKLELQIRGLGTVSFNGVPVINNREYSGTINILDGQTAVIAGSLSRTELRSTTGLPGLSRVPGLREATSFTSKEVDAGELLVTLTPHIVQSSEHPASASGAFLPPTP